MKIEIEIEHGKGKVSEEKMKEYMEMERKVHSWASDEILRKIVEDELALDPEYYEREEKDEEESEEEAE